MRYGRLFVGFSTLVSVLLLAAVRPVDAAPIRDDEVVFGDDVTVRDGEHVNGDLVMFGGNLKMWAGSRVEGSVTALGGQVEVDGAVDGDLVALGGQVSLGANARVNGDIVALGGSVHKAEGAQTGKIVTGLTIKNAGSWRELRLPFFSPGVGSGAGFDIEGVIVSLTSAVILALLGMAIVTFWPTQTAQVGEKILTAPVPSLAVGCLIFPLSVSVAIFVLITICLAPLMPVVVVLVVAAILFGWVALGTLWGRRLMRWMGLRRVTPVVAAGVGVFVLSVVAAALGAIPCLGLIVTLGAASLGLGAVALSRFGISRHGWRREVRSEAGVDSE